MKTTTIEVKVLEIKFPREGQDNPRGWYSLATDKGIVTGNIKWRPAVNELLKLTGNYTEWKGMRQFKFTEAVLNVPIDAKSQLDYVAERTRGMGEQTVKAIWELLGDGWQKLSASDAKALKIKPAVLEEFRKQIQNLVLDKEKADTISFLMSKGCSSSMGATAYEQWGKDAVGVVNNNCYRLADLPHYGFKDVDGDIRKNYGIDDHDPRRIKAAVIYCMKQLTSSGSTVVAWMELVKHLGAMLINLQLASQCISEMFNDFTLCSFPREEMIAIGTHYNAETAILKFLKAA